MARIFSDYFSSYPATEMHRTAIAAVRNGYAVVPVEPGGKATLCTLTSRQRADDPKHACGVHHAITDDRVANRVFRRIAQALGRQPNIGVVAHPSRLVVVDADGPEAVQQFLARWAQAEADEGYLQRSPTVSTPGSRRGGEWRHHDGGHFYFGLPDGIDLPTYPGQLIMPGGADVRWGMLMTVAPPSVRPEGAYIVHGDMPDLPGWLLHEIRAYTDRRIARSVRDVERFANDTIARWSMATRWADLLVPDGWRDTNKLDRRCGCPVFEKPAGGATSDRSAIGHENDCELYENLEGHGALHLFTTEPPEELAAWCAEHATSTLTKLQYVAAVHHGGDVDLAKVALGIEPDLGPWLETLRSAVPSSQISRGGGLVTAADQGVSEPQSPDLGDRETGETGADRWRPELPDNVRQSVISLAAIKEKHRLADEYRAWRRSGNGLGLTLITADRIEQRANDATIAHRVDGAALLYAQRVNTIWGPSETGKSWFALACCRDVIERGGQALYIDVEDDEYGFAARLGLFGLAPEQLHYARPWAAMTEPVIDVLADMANRCQLVVVDSLDALLSLLQLDANSNVAVRQAGTLLKSWSRGGAAVLTVDHSSEKLAHGDKATTALGSSGKKALIDGVMLRSDRETVWRPNREFCSTMVMLGKDRHGSVKRYAELPHEHASFGRITRLRLTPGIGSSPAELELLVPPSYADVPDEVMVTAEERDEIEQAVISALLAGGWLTRTALCKAAGDKNGRRGIGRAIDELLASYGGALETRHTTVGGNTFAEYRLPKADT